MKCPYCDQEIEDGSTTCSLCGKALSETKPVQNEASSESQPVTLGKPQDGGTPETPADSAGEAEAPTGETKKSGMKKWGIIAVAAAVVAIIAAIAFVPKKNPKDIVIDAFKSITVKGQTNPMEEIFGIDEMTAMLSQQSSELQMELQIQDSSNSTIQQMITGKFGMTALNDVENKKMFLSMGVGFADMNLANLLCYLDDKQIVVAIPEFSEKAFSLNYADDLEGQIANSPFLGQMLEESGTDITGLNDYLEKYYEIANSENQIFDVQALWNRYKEGSKAIDDLKAAMTVEKADKKDFTIDEKSQSCNGYNVTVTKDALIQFLTTTKEFFLADETLKKDFVEYISLVTQLQGTMVMYSDMADMTPEELQQETWKTVEEAVDYVIEQLKESMGDVSMVVYVRKDGKMAAFDYNTTANLFDEDIKLYGTVSFAGGYSMMANVNATLNLEDTAGEVITISVDKTGAYEAGKSLAGTLTAAATNGEETYSMEYSGDYTVEGGAYNVSLDFLADGNSAFKLTSNGLVSNLEKGKTIEIIMDSIKMELNTYADVLEYIDISGSYYVGPLQQTVEIPEGEDFDVLAATDEDWNAVFYEIIGNAYSVMMGLNP